MSVFNEHQFEKRLQLLKDSQESIQSLSAWCLQHRQHHKKIVATWLRILKKVKVEQRVTLFYLANDVIQYSKRKNYEFVESWGTALQRATTLVREDKVKSKILRIFQVWDDRGIYDDTFLSDLRGLISTSTKKSAQEPVIDNSDFQPNVLFDKIRSCKLLEDDTDMKLRKLNEGPISFSDIEALRTRFKDRRQGDDMVAEVDDGLNKIKAYISALEAEIKERTMLIDLLEQGDNFYNTQKGEARVVANAYRNFGSRVRNLKRHLDEMMPTLKDSSPVPSPDVNAPSPSPDSDLELPGENSTTAIPGNTFLGSFPVDTQPIQTVGSQDDQSVDKGFSSFMGNSLPFDIQKNLFSEASRDILLSSSSQEPTADSITIPGLSAGLEESEEKPIKSEENSLGKPIEVISSRSKPEETFNITEFLKSLIPSASTTTAIPGLTLEEGDPQPETAPLQKQLSFSGDSEIPSAATTEYDYPPLSTSSSPLQPPPVPPNLFQSDEDASYKYEQTQETTESWNTKLPPKFPTWGDTNAGWEADSGEKVSEWMPVLPVNKVPVPDLDTPESPPMYEKEGFSDPVEYDDSVVNPVMLSSSTDVDHRTLVPLPLASVTTVDDPLPLEEHLEDTDHRMLIHIPPPNHVKKDVDHRPTLHRKKDIDHRNLISLTGSPVREPRTPAIPPTNPAVLSWLRGDQDYRAGKTVPATDLDVSVKKEETVDGDIDYRNQVIKMFSDNQNETADTGGSADLKKSLVVNTENSHNVETIEYKKVGTKILSSKKDEPMDTTDPRKISVKTISHKRDETQDNVESVDMEMSDDEVVDSAVAASSEAIKSENDSFGMLQNSGKTVSFNINNQAKVLFSSPLNEVSEESPKSRNRVYGCHKIPTIGGSMPPPRQRNPPLPSVVPPRCPIRPSLLSTLPPPPPPPPPPPLPPDTNSSEETISSSVRIKPLSELLAGISELPSSANSAKTKEVLNGSKEDSTSPQILNTENESAKTVIPKSENKLSAIPGLEAIKEFLNSTSTSVQGTNTLSIGQELSEWMKDSSSQVTEGSNGSGTGIETIVTAPNSATGQKLPEQSWGQPAYTTHENEPWFSDEIPSFESHVPMGGMPMDMGRMGRGQNMVPPHSFPNPPPPTPPFVPGGPPLNAPLPGAPPPSAPPPNTPPPGVPPPPLMHGTYNPRMRPTWAGPRRGIPPPPRFPYRPPHDPNMGRGFCGGFRPPFRGNPPRPYGGW